MKTLWFLAPYTFWASTSTSTSLVDGHAAPSIHLQTMTVTDGSG
jgi:hypothetical protein